MSSVHEAAVTHAVVTGSHAWPLAQSPYEVGHGAGRGRPGHRQERRGAAAAASTVAEAEPAAPDAADRRIAEVLPPEMEDGAKAAVTPLGSPELESFHAVVPAPPIVTVRSA